MYCIIDTETTGLFDFKQPADAPGQPRMASFAMLAADEDCNLICATSVLIRPNGWVMTQEAERINGLSQQLLEAHGVPVEEVLTRYAGEIIRGAVVVAHNAQYDTKIMRAEFRRAGLPDLYEQTKVSCTMEALTDILQLPKRNGHRGYKWPSLAESIERCMGHQHVGAHGALQDAIAALDLLRWLKREGRLPPVRAGKAAA